MINSDRHFELRSGQDWPGQESKNRQAIIGQPSLSRLIDNQAYQIEIDAQGRLTAREVSPFEVMFSLESLDFVQDEVLA